MESILQGPRSNSWLSRFCGYLGVIIHFTQNSFAFQAVNKEKYKIRYEVNFLFTKNIENQIVIIVIINRKKENNETPSLSVNPQNKFAIGEITNFNTFSIMASLISPLIYYNLDLEIVLLSVETDIDIRDHSKDFLS